MSDWDRADDRAIDEPVDDPEHPEPAPLTELPLDVPEADALEQAIDVGFDDDLPPDDDR